MKIHLATDHAGLELKNTIRESLIEKRYEVIDHGAFEYDALDDYPDFIFPCAKAVAADQHSKGIILGGSGQGEAMAANRIKGVRAAVFYDGPIDILKLSTISSLKFAKTDILPYSFVFGLAKILSATSF